MIWKVRNSEIDLASKAMVMGVLNVTLDSFSDGGKYAEAKQAITKGYELIEAGAEIIDVGGESTRPGAEGVPEEIELQRVLPVIRELARQERAWISIDTMKATVAAAAIDAGAHIINDVTGLKDPAMVKVVRESGAGAVVMHMQGMPRTMQEDPNYEDVAREVGEFFARRAMQLTATGISPEQLVYDPGIGFGKRVQHNLELLRTLGCLGAMVPGRPLLLGVSRKSFIGMVTSSRSMEERDWPTVTLSSYGREQGVRIFRVHDPKPNLEAIRMTEAILGVPIAAECARVP